MSYDSPSRRLKDLVLRGLSLPWEGCFAALGAFGRPRVEPWSPASGDRVLVVSPHPDDEVHGCGGAILRHTVAGDSVTVVHVTDGRRSRALGLAPTEMARRRRLEAEAAADVLGLATMEWLGFPEGAWEELEAADALVGVLARIRPRVVYAPSVVDFHPEHRRVAGALGRSLTSGPELLQCRIRVYPVQVPLTSILANRIVVTDPVADRSRAALECYVTQAGALRASLRMKRYAALRYGAGSQAEVFWELSPRAYHTVHVTGREEEIPDQGSSGGSTYRGIRRLPFTDPLAYQRGREARRRVLSSAME